MRLEGDRIYEWMQVVAEGTEKLVIISPFFSTSGEIGRLLETVQNLKILVGDEFSTNNPRHLMKLAALENTDVRFISRRVGAFENRLHAKVFYAVEASERVRAMVGSANFTVSGLTKNREQSVSFDSEREGDKSILDGLDKWINELDNLAEEIDWERAMKEYERAATPHFPTDDFDAYRADQADNYWVLKTTMGSHGKSLWPKFLRERVVSIGWEEIVEIASKGGRVQPTEYTLETLRAAAGEWAGGRLGARSTAHAARMLHKFSREFSIGDRIILCRGYGGLQTSDVWLYGLAVVDDEVVDHAGSCWWRLKRRAVFRPEERGIPKDVFVNALGKGSLLHTIHSITEREYMEFRRLIREH